MMRPYSFKIKKADIVVGIPSYNEADNIGFVAKQIDLGLKKYFPRSKSVIINIDNNSPDNTKRAFFQTKTAIPKIYISTLPGILGKGNNFYNLFKKTAELEGKIIIVVDADLKSITPEWVKKLGKPIEKGYDYVLPLYNRNEYDGSITNHICYPLIYGLLGINVRQPIGGDFALSKNLSDYLLKQNWTTENVKNYGVDIFATLNAIFGKFKLAQVDLENKIHKPSAPKLGPMFIQVADTCFRMLNQNKEKWLKKTNIFTPSIIYKNKRTVQPQRLSIDYKDLKQKSLYEFSLFYETLQENLSPAVYKELKKMYFQKKILNIGSDLWAKILYEMLYAYDKSSSKTIIIRALRPLYFGRTVSFIKKTLELNSKESEIKIQNQAEHFYKKRNYLLRKYK